MALKVRLVTIAGNVDLDPPDGFEFGAFITSIRLNNYFCNPFMYVPITSILAAFVYDTDKQELPLMPNVAEAKGTLQ